MKKFIVMLGVVGLAVFGGFAIRSISAETTTAPTTTAEAITTSSSADDSAFLYADLDDLIDQIYQEVYDEVYQEIYQTASAAVDEAMVEEIYAQVLSDLEGAIASGSVSVVANELQERVDAVVGIADAAVVGVSTYAGSEGVALGSGVVYRDDAVAGYYYLVTNEHVVDGGDNFRVVFADGSETTAELLGADPVVDIAVLRFAASGAPATIVPSTLGDSDDVSTGMIVLACGNPRGYDFYGSLTMGVVAGTDRDVAGDGVVLYIQHDASINSGNSGGPLYGLDGRVIGINVSKFATTDIEGMGFAIPINAVKSVIAAFDSGF